MDNKLAMSQQCDFMTKKANSVLSCIRKSAAIRLRGMVLSHCSALLRHTGTAGSGAGCPVKVGQRDGHTALSPTKGHDQETGASLIGGEAARGGLSSLERRRFHGISLMYRNT